MTRTAASRVAETTAAIAATPAPFIQRACACGASAGISGDKCGNCEKDEQLGVERPPTSGLVQPKLTIGTPGDAYEREADAVADRIMRMPSPGSQPIEVKDEAEEEEEKMLQRQAANTAAPAPAAVSSAATAVATGGQPLPPGERSFFESRLGRDLSRVRIHNDAAAQRAARGIHARAYTLRNHIAFAPGQFSPGTARGRRLMAHEITHTIQQGASRSNRIQRVPSIEATPHNSDACACLVHVHNDERNAKAVANLLQDTCDYNLLQISPDNRSRHLGSRVRLPNGRRENDPNQFFDQDLVQNCEFAIASGCDPLTTNCPNTGNFSCEFYANVRRCSNVFSVPVVALHNNVESDTERYRNTLGNRRGPTIGSQLFGRGKTNIFQWCRSPAISRCIIGDRDHPDHVIWASNEADFLRLAGSPGVNVALQDREFTDEDLSSLFNILPNIQLMQFVANLVLPIDLFQAGLPGNANDYRYVNIETPHSAGRFDANLAVDNFMFVTSVLDRLGLSCCDTEALEDLRGNQTDLESRLTETNEAILNNE